MKDSSVTPSKRRWTCFSVTVPIVVFLSLIGTVSVLLGLHTRFPSAYFTDENSAMENSFLGMEGIEEPRTTQEVTDNIASKADGNYHNDTIDPRNVIQRSTSRSKATTSQSNPGSTGLPTSPVLASKITSSQDTRGSGQSGSTSRGPTGDATEKSCQLEFGSYCLWSIENKEAMKDVSVKRLKDQNFVARAYYPSIAKLKGQEKLSREMKQNIQEHERMLSEAIADGDLPPFVQKR